LEDSKWWTNIHGAKEYEVGGDSEGGSYYEWIQKLANGYKYQPHIVFLPLCLKQICNHIS